MSETTGSAATEAVAAEAPAQETDWKAKYEETVAESRKWESRAKDNKGAAEKLAEIEEASKSEAEKLAERAEAAEKALADAKADSLRLSVIAKHSIPEEFHEFISGATEEELVAKAEKVQKLIEASTTPATRHVVISGEGKSPALALNGDGIESALKTALGIA